MMRLSTLFAVFAGVLLACAPAEPRPAPKQEATRGAVREPLRTVAARTPVSLRPTPDAKAIDGVHSVVLAPGFGSAKPAPGPQTLLAISYLAYDESGAMTGETPVALMELDRVPAEWRGVLRDMVAGEKRRVWVPEGAGFRLWDLELQSIGKSR